MAYSKKAPKVMISARVDAAQLERCKRLGIDVSKLIREAMARELAEYEFLLEQTYTEALRTKAR